MICFVLFFFKQKTAYEMRISDWSSDVCSSDLRALDFPIVSGNVSLYNETNGVGILPTPAIGGVGLLKDYDKMATIGFKAEGEAIYVKIGRASCRVRVCQAV